MFCLHRRTCQKIFSVFPVYFFLPLTLVKPKVHRDQDGYRQSSSIAIFFRILILVQRPVLPLFLYGTTFFSVPLYHSDLFPSRYHSVKLLTFFACFSSICQPFR